MSKEKAAAVVGMSEVYGAKLSMSGLRIYVQALADYTSEQVQAAIQEAMKSAKFFPRPAELIEICRTAGTSYATSAELGFANLENALKENKPSLMDPVTKVIVRQLGGFQYLREIPLSSYNVWVRKDFIKTHMTLSKENPERLAAITGKTSDIAIAFKGVPTREDIAKIEADNRKLLTDLAKKER